MTLIVLQADKVGHIGYFQSVVQLECYCSAPRHLFIFFFPLGSYTALPFWGNTSPHSQYICSSDSDPYPLRYQWECYQDQPTRASLVNCCEPGVPRATPWNARMTPTQRKAEPVV